MQIYAIHYDGYLHKRFTLYLMFQTGIEAIGVLWTSHRYFHP